MKRHLNTLFVLTQGAYLRKSGEAVEVHIDEEQKLRVPIHGLQGIVCFGRVGVSPFLLGLCGERGVAVSFMTQSGRFMARASGFTPGNVLLRREQYRLADLPDACLAISRPIVQAKIANCRSVLMRASRDHGDPTDRLSYANELLARCIRRAGAARDLDQLRGVEGEAARGYFSVFSKLIRRDDDSFDFSGRSRRPPGDNVNALLSYLYAILAHDLRAACEAAGLDPAVGYLHKDRPGRPGLALDLMEEFRPHFVDRTVLTLLNRKQVRATGFRQDEAGGIRMSEETRKTVLKVYQKRKQEELSHPYLGEKTTIGLFPQLQARLLARMLRGDLDAYPALVWPS